MAAHLGGYLVATSGGDGLRGPTRAGRSPPGERLGASLLVDDAADVLAAAAVAGPMQYRVSDNACSATHGEAIANLDSTRQLDKGRKYAAKLQRDGEEGPDGRWGFGAGGGGLSRRSWGEKRPGKRPLGAWRDH